MNSFMAIDNNANIQGPSIEYIVPQIVKYQNIDDLLENNKITQSFFDTNEYMSIDDVLQEKFVCVVGEPGIGKSQLVAEIEKRASANLYSEEASKFSTKGIPVDTKYCVIDALDEVDGNSFHDVLISIRNYKEENPNVNVIFTCRKHYVASYSNHFSVCNKLNYIELLRLKESDVLDIVRKKCHKTTYQNISICSRLKELLTIPRYLIFILEYGKKQRECSNVGELFEYVVGCSIQTAINGCQIKNENLNVLIQRVLEKLAFIMEISRKDQITKDELYSILDGIKGNMAQMLIANVDLLFFKNRILKETNGILQFENTEIQEYLAAKELCRQENIESVLHDIAVQQKLKHIYPNWYDVIPHISYTKDKVSTFINVFKLIVSYESNLENKAFENLLKYVDPSVLSLQQKEDQFLILFKHYQRISAYIMWRGPISELLQEYYTPSCDAEIMLPLDQLNKVQLSNIYVTLDAIVEENKLSKCVSDYWVNAANDLMATDNNEKKLAALNLYNALKCTDELIQLSRSYSGLSKELKEKYCEITGYKQFVDKNVVDCWLDGCYVSNPYALNAVLCIEDTTTLIYAYKKIIDNDKLREFFNPKGALHVHYECYLKRQIEKLLKENLDYKKIATIIIANFIGNNSYTTYNDINTIVKQILLEEAIGTSFFQCFDTVWDIEEVFRRFDAELIDIELISSVDKLLHKTKIEDWYINNILTSLVYKIKNDESKKPSISEYVERYAEIFEQWDRNSRSLEERTNANEQRLLEIFQNLLEPDVSEYYKYEAALELSQNIDFIKRQDSLQPFVDIISKFFNEIDLDKLVLQKTSDNSFSLSKSLVKIPYYVKALYQLGISDLLIAHRDLLAKTLPMICCTSSIDAREIREIYRKIIGSIGENEKVGLIEWWKSREDDFMNISLEDIFTCITDYGIDTLSYKLEEFVEQYTENQENLGRRIAASKALDIISEGYCDWDLDRYKALFNISVDDSITSVKMQCNAIMIEKFQDSNAIIWRIEYLKNNVVQSLNNDMGHARAISCEESEMISPNPRMFRCFMSITENNLLAEQLLDLFDFGLSLTVNKETQEYSSYLLNQIYFFFVNSANIYNISELRKRVEAFNATHISYLANSIMNGFEMMFLQNEKTNISKAIKLYNKCIEEAHLKIRNNDDLRRYFTYVHSEVQKEIQDQGIYSLVRQNNLSEDFIQRELKNTIINKCCQMGLNAVWVDREVTLQDNKRTDLLIRYGLCNPIMVELKLLHNKEIQNKKQRQEYKKKFIQYTNATNACLSVFWVFKIHRKESETSAFNSLKAEYKELDNTLVLLTDCKCSSGIETGLPKKQARLKAKK